MSGFTSFMISIFLATGALTVTTARSAEAETSAKARSADGCVRTKGTPASCVQVKGASTYVDWARGGVLLRARGSARGYFYVYDARRQYINFSTTPDVTFSNERPIAQTFWGTLHNVKKNLPDSREVCARFIERRGSQVVRHSPACITIQR